MKLGMAQFQAMIEAPESICYCMVGQTFYKNVTGTKDPQIWKQANVTALEIGFGNQPCYSGGSYHPSARLWSSSLFMVLIEPLPHKGLSQSPNCSCGEPQTMSHIVDDSTWCWRQCSQLAEFCGDYSTHEIITVLLLKWPFSSWAWASRSLWHLFFHLSWKRTSEVTCTQVSTCSSCHLANSIRARNTKGLTPTMEIHHLASSFLQQTPDFRNQTITCKFV